MKDLVYEIGTYLEAQGFAFPTTTDGETVYFLRESALGDRSPVDLQNDGLANTEVVISMYETEVPASSPSQNSIEERIVRFAVRTMSPRKGKEIAAELENLLTAKNWDCGDVRVHMSWRRQGWTLKVGDHPDHGVAGDYWHLFQVRASEIRGA